MIHNNNWIRLLFLILIYIIGVNEVKIAVIGGGSIGLLVGYYLSNHHDVTMFVRRKEQKDSIQSNNIKLIQAATLYNGTNVEAKLLNDMDSSYDLYIICVKQTHLQDVLPYIDKLSCPSSLLFLQNGMGHIETIQTYGSSVFIGVVSHGAHRSSDNEVSHLGDGVIKIASITGNSEELHSLTNLLHQKAFPISPHSDWENLLKEKLIINAVINPITALFDVPNGRILMNEHLHYLAKKLCEEAATVLQLPVAESWDEIVYVAEQTKENVSSMRADIHQGHRTEVEAITGYILKQALVEVPYTNFIYRGILALNDERI